MDPEDGENIEPNEGNSSFLEDSSFVEIFEAEKFEKGLNELSEIRKDQDEEEENPMDKAQLGPEDTSEVQGDQADLGDFLQGIKGQNLEEIDEFRRVHKFTSPILSAEEIAQAKMEVIAFSESGQDTDSKPQPASAETIPESVKASRKGRIEIESEEVHTNGWNCSVCWEPQESNALQTYCAVF